MSGEVTDEMEGGSVACCGVEQSSAVRWRRLIHAAYSSSRYKKSTVRIYPKTGNEGLVGE
jgi:hypothetical protein